MEQGSNRIQSFLPGSLPPAHVGQKQTVILPVEDERIVARDLQLRLKRLGYDVPFIATNKDEAIALVEQLNPDLVLMDITLDGSPDGIEAAQEIRNHHDLPVIYLTAHSDSETLQRAKITEPSGYILKPFEDGELMATIETALHKHQVDRRVRLAERWLTATLRSIGDAVITTDEHGRISFMNRIAEELTGWTGGQAVGKALLEVLQFPDERAAAAVREVVEQVRRSGIASALSEPTLLISSSGQQRLISDSLAPLVDEHGRNVGLVLVFRDVSERERMQTELRASHGLLDAVFSAQTDALMVCDTDGVVIRTNPAAKGLFGFDSTGMPLSDMLDKFALTGGLDASVTQRALHGETTINLEQTARDRYIETSSAPMRDESGGILGAVTISRDITDRKRAEERLREAQKLESIAVLAGGIAHDFNNLLGIVMGNASMALDKCAVCDNMQEILVATERAAELTRQLLAYAGKGRFVSELVNLSELVSGSQELLRASVAKKVRLEFALAEDLPCLEADPGQLRQVLMNLVINAGEAISGDQAGLVRISTGKSVITKATALTYAPVYQVEPGEFAFLEIQDNGAGIDPGLKPRIFEPFFSTKFTGRGLGLAAVQGVVRAYKGIIEVESTPGNGTSFRVFLPASEKRKTKSPVPASPLVGSRGAGTVLVVDDEEMLRKMAALMLRGYGYEVLQAANGEEALEVLASSTVKPSLVLLDLTMPVMGGDELLPIIETKYPGLKVILSSGYSEEDVASRLRSPAVAGFLHKPYAGDALASKVKQVLS